MHSKYKVALCIWGFVTYKLHTRGRYDYAAELLNASPIFNHPKKMDQGYPEGWGSGLQRGDRGMDISLGPTETPTSDNQAIHALRRAGIRDIAMAELKAILTGLS